MKISSKGEYYGAKRLEESFNGVLLSEYDYHIQKTDWHYHENPYFMYVIHGNVGDINKQQKRECSPGTLIFHNWQEAHFNTLESKKARGFHIEFERKWFQEKQIDVELWEGTQIIGNPSIHHLLGKIYAEFKFSDRLSDLSIELLLFQVCESIQNIKEKRSFKTPIWIEELKDILHQSDHVDLSLDYLSKELDLHPGHISRAIPKYFNCTLGNYIRQEKVKKAIKLLHNPQKSLQDITYECGFSDQSHFIRTFKHFMGITPKQFRLKAF